MSMQSSTTMSRFGLVGKIFQGLLAVKGLISIALLIGSLLGFMMSELIDQRRTMRDDFNESLERITAAEAGFRAAGDLTYQAVARTRSFVSVENVQNLAPEVLNLRNTLLSSVVPNGRIETARDAYVERLNALQGQLNLFVPSVDGTESVLESLILVQTPADDFHAAANDFKNSIWPSFWAAF